MIPSPILPAAQTLAQKYSSRPSGFLEAIQLKAKPERLSAGLFPATSDPWRHEEKFFLFDADGFEEM